MKSNLLKLFACFYLLVIANSIHAQSWSLTGNTGTVDGTNFIGTTDNKPFNIRVNNLKAGRIDPALFNTFYGIQSGASNTTGTYNIATGYNALYRNTTGSGNLAIGFSALYANTTGGYNTALGYGALDSNTTGTGNFANGTYALRYNTTGIYNTASGYSALYNNTSGNYNIGVGYAALLSNTTGSYNTATGWAALYSNTTGIGNLAYGYAALRYNTTGSYNTATGYAALTQNYSGGSNTANGYQALYSNTTGGDNTANGNGALYSNTTGTSNTANGFLALYFNTTGVANSANGVSALQSNTTGLGNTANGVSALFYNTTGNSNTADGEIALTSNISGTNNTALGFSADVASANLTNATAIGSGAIVNASNTIQLGNSAITQVLAGTGSNAILVAGGLKITGGTPSVGKILTSDASGLATWQIPGNSTGWTLTGNSGTVDGANFIGTTDAEPFNIRVNNQKAGRIDFVFEAGNTFYGYLSGVSNTFNNNETNSTGAWNTGNGYAALNSNTTGSKNTATGCYSLPSNTTGVGNTATGYTALSDNTTGVGNTGTGIFALIYNYTGNYNTAIGYSAGVNADGYTNSTALGNEATITGSNQVVLGNSSIANIYAQVTGITALSDTRFKKNIKEDVPGLEFINLLRPVTYNYDIKGFNTHIKGNPPVAAQQQNTIDSAMGKALPKMPPMQPTKEDEAGIAQKEKINYTGLVAQEVETAANKVGYDFSGLHKPQNDKDTYGLNYTDFVVPLIKSVQELSASNDSLKNQNALQQQQNELQQQQNNDLLNRLNQLEIKLESLVKGGVSGSSTLLSSAKLEQNIPNPFNQTTLINYYVPETAGHAFIKVTGMNGNAIKTIELNNTGSGQITLQTATLASGNYTYSLFVDGNLIDTKVMVLAR